MAEKQVVRDPSHAGSWYTDSKSQLNAQLEGWLNSVKPPVKGIGSQSASETFDQLPVPSARMIIAPYVIYS